MPSQEELRKELVNSSRNYRDSQKTLSTKLKEMGFSENSFMTISGDAKVGQRGPDGRVVPDQYLSCGPDHISPNSTAYQSDGALNDQNIGSAIGGLGSNNGLYSAQVKHGQEIIITEDRKIYEALQKMGFKEDAIGVPMSNGGIFVDFAKQDEFVGMKNVCARNRDNEGQEKRTAAVQRGDIITTYDPNSKGEDGVYKNVRHYEKSADGSFRSVSMYEASHILQTQQQYGANTNESIAKGKQLDSNVVQQMLKNNMVRY